MMNEATDLNVSIIADVFSQLDAKSNNPNPAKNNEMLNISVINNLIDDINSMVLLYDNNKLNEDVQKRIKIDTNDIISEINKNNYNYVIESINMIIKNIIDNV